MTQVGALSLTRLYDEGRVRKGRDWWHFCDRVRPRSPRRSVRAVGQSDFYLGADYGWSLIERYTASTGWTTDGPDPALSGEHLYGVACGALECSAVGGNAVDIEPVIAESTITTASVGGGGSHGTSGLPSSGTTASTGSAGPGVPDTGGAGSVGAAPDRWRLRERCVGPPTSLDVHRRQDLTTRAAPATALRHDHPSDRDQCDDRRR